VGKPVIAANWKMNKTLGETEEFIEKFKKEIASTLSAQQVEVVLIPPYTALKQAADSVKGSAIKIGAQNMYWEEQGAYTGEVSPVMLRDIGCTYVVLGHSERRQYFGESDEWVNKKVKAAIAHGLIPIVCVGEKINEREAGATEQVIRKQVEGSLAGLHANQVAGMVIAYEPVWAIGTGKTASEEDAQRVNKFIRGIVAEMVGQKAAEEMFIQYGGSVKPGNAAGLMAQPDIDGALVGGASLDPESFAAIIRAAVTSYEILCLPSSSHVAGTPISNFQHPVRRRHIIWQ